MTREEVMEKVCEIARDIFDDDELVLEDDTVASDVDGWDSLTHLSLMNEIEEEFGIRTTAIVTMKEVTECLWNRPYNGRTIIDDEIKAAIDRYMDEYGAKE